MRSNGTIRGRSVITLEGVVYGLRHEPVEFLTNLLISHGNFVELTFGAQDPIGEVIAISSVQFLSVIRLRTSRPGCSVLRSSRAAIYEHVFVRDAKGSIHLSGSWVVLFVVRSVLFAPILAKEGSGRPKLKAIPQRSLVPE